MSRTHRLFQLMQHLRRLPPPVTAQQLADDMDVSLRTVYRDIDALRGLGAVIDGEAGFGCPRLRNRRWSRFRPASRRDRRTG